MTTDKTITLDRTEILGMISCAETFGFANSVLLSAFSDWLGRVTDEEIDAYARSVADSPGYSEEDYEVERSTLLEWRGRYGVQG